MFLALLRLVLLRHHVYLLSAPRNLSQRLVIKRLYVRNRSNCAAPKLPGSYHTIEASKVLVRYVIPLFTITISLQALKVASQFVVNQPMFQLQCKDIHLRNKTGSVVRHTHRRKVDSEYTPALLRTDNMHTRSLHVYLVFSE